MIPWLRARYRGQSGCGCFEEFGFGFLFALSIDGIDLRSVEVSFPSIAVDQLDVIANTL
jgi:hypothetical protein